MSRFLIPRSFDAIAELCSTELTRYALNGVHLIRNADGRMVAEASDGALGMRVEYKEPSQDDYPVLPNFPEGNHPEAIVPTDYWRKSLSRIKPVRNVPILKHAMVAATREKSDADDTAPRVAFGSTDCDEVTITSQRGREGTFPDLSIAFPKINDKAQVVCINLSRLIELATAMDKVLHAEGRRRGNHAAWLVIPDQRTPQPIMLQGRDGDGDVFARGILMPLNREWHDEAGPKPGAVDAAAPNESGTAIEAEQPAGKE